MRRTWMAALLVACSSSTLPEDVAIRLERGNGTAVIGVPDAYQITIANSSLVDVHVSIPPCGAALDISTGTGVRAGPWTGQPCAAGAAPPIRLAPGEMHRAEVQWNGSAIGTSPSPSFVQPGRYLVKAVLYLNGVRVESEPVQVDLRAP